MWRSRFYAGFKIPFLLPTVNDVISWVSSDREQTIHFRRLSKVYFGHNDVTDSEVKLIEVGHLGKIFSVDEV